MPLNNPHHKPQAFKAGSSKAKAGTTQTANSSPAEEFSDSRVIRLSPDDQLSLARALITPPKPNAALRAAIARYKALSGQ